MKEAPENGKESSHSAHASGMNNISNTGITICICTTYDEAVIGIIATNPYPFSLFLMGASNLIYIHFTRNDQPRDLVVRVSDY